jgi:hypothetical protein
MLNNVNQNLIIDFCLFIIARLSDNGIHIGKPEFDTLGKESDGSNSLKDLIFSPPILFCIRS